MHRRTATSASSSKVSASRERRAKRVNKLNNGGIKKQGHPKQYSGKRILFLASGLLIVCLLLIWVGAMYHVTRNSGDGKSEGGNEDSWKIGKVSLPKNAIRRMRNGKSKYLSANEDIKSEPDQNPYSLTALKKNPYLGWQPPLTHSPLGSSFSWRTCFKADPKSDGSDQPAGCNENPAEMGSNPPVAKDWVPDVTMVRTMMMHGKDINGNPFPPPLSKELCEGIGVRGEKRGDTNKECLIESVIRPTGALNSTTVTISPSNHYGQPENGIIQDPIIVPAPKLMCLVYTMADAHANRIRAMQQTWAGGCDGFLAFSTESDPRLPAISLEHEGPEAYENMWQKVRSIWKFVGTHYIDDYDWFFIGGDDLFVLPHNLKTYLASLAHKDGTNPKTKEYFVGRRFNGGSYFNSGGAGYTLSRATLRKFVANMEDAQHCAAKQRTSMEDVMIARCLTHLGIHFTDTRDARGRERFHPFAPGSHLHWTPPKPGGERDWYEDYNKEWGILEGKDCCAPDSVSFHYIKKASMVRHMQALLYSCDLEDQ
mmetsp:Transcript_23953/g.50138  ORF Transcript_23953/g.50138 Transcript_23953/m.50138 type:complete len:539 (-) Transcript_23953:373-1989(-)